MQFSQTDPFGTANLGPAGVADVLNRVAKQNGKQPGFFVESFEKGSPEEFRALLKKHPMASVVLNIRPSEYDAIRKIYEKNGKTPPNFNDPDNRRHFVVALDIFHDNKGVERVLVRNTHGDITAPTLSTFVKDWRASEGALVYDESRSQEQEPEFSFSPTPLSNDPPPPPPPSTISQLKHKILRKRWKDAYHLLVNRLLNKNDFSSSTSQ